eukprot:COSAG02_NODE_31600_length_530_cov_3.252900_1_plen_131_part_01
MTAAGLENPEDICIDDVEWKDAWWRPCSWYAVRDPGCTKYYDQGQRHHCPNACHTCEERVYTIPVPQKYRFYRMLVTDVGRRGTSLGSFLVLTHFEFLLGREQCVWPATVPCHLDEGGSRGLVFYAAMRGE